MAARRLGFSDDRGHEQEVEVTTPYAASEEFEGFVRTHLATGSTSFMIEDEANDEALVLLYAQEAIARIKNPDDPVTEYRLVRNRGDYLSAADNFIARGHQGVDRPGRWLPDLASLERARLHEEVDETWLRRTRPRELRRRLAVLTCIDGHEPETIGGATRYGFGNGGGDTVTAWFTADGRGLITTFDHESPLNSSEDPQRQAALYAGVPDDLLALARDVPGSGVHLTVAHPDGGTLVAATGVFVLSGPLVAADGLVAYLQESGHGLDDTGIGFLLDSFLALEEFTPEALVEETPLWGADDVRAGFARAAELEPAPATEPLDPALLERFGRAWADHGYNDRWDVHYVLFDGYSREEVEAERAELLQVIAQLGLDVVDAPADAATGEVWVRTDPRVDAEIEQWA